MTDKSNGAMDILADVLLPSTETQRLYEARRTRQAMEHMAAVQTQALEQSAFAHATASGDVEALRWRLETVEKRNADLLRQVLSLGLYCRTLLQVLVDSDTVTVERFTKRMTDVDMADGVLDGR